MEQERVEVKPSSPNTPLTIYQRLKDNALLGKDMDPNRFLADLADLDRTGAIRRQPLLQERFLLAGQDPMLRTAVLAGLGESHLAGNKKELKRNRRLAEILGIKASAAYLPPKRGLKTKAALVFGAGLVTVASVVGSAGPAFLPPVKAVDKEVTSGQTQSPEESTPVPSGTGPTPTATVTFLKPPIPSPSPTKAPTPKSTETPTRTATTQPTPKPEVKTLKIEVPKKDILREVVVKRTYQEVLKVREQRRQTDAEYQKRVDLELNNGKLNGVLLGIGKEGALTDSIQVFSYDIGSHTLTIVSIPRDLISPEVYRVTKNIASARINQALAVGGTELARQALENATSLSMDFVVVGGFEVLIDLIDEVFGTIEVQLDQPIKDPYYPAMRGFGYDPFYIEAGTHQVNGLTASKIARSRMTTSDYDRSKRQQLIINAIISKFFKDGPVEAFKKLVKARQVIDQKAKNGSFKINFDLVSLLTSYADEIKSSVPAMLWDKLQGQDWKIGQQPTINTFVVSNQNLVVGAGIPGVAETKITGGNPYSPNPRNEYWSKLRKTIRQQLPQTAPPQDEALKVNNGGLIKEVIAPKLLLEVGKIRQEKASHDPKWVERVDSELNRGRINILLIGTGSEMAWNGEDFEGNLILGLHNMDAIMVTSYSASDNKISAISLHRDAFAPEISRFTPGKHELMTAIQYGGIPLAEEIVENSSGLAMDYYVKLRPEAVAEFVNRIFGKLKITVPEDIPLDQYGTSFDKGEQEMDGRRLLQYIQTRTSSSIERRNSAQQQVMETMMDELFKRFEKQNVVQNIQMLTQIQGVVSDLVKEEKLETNLNLGMVIEAVKSEWLSVTTRLIKSKITGGQIWGKPAISKLVFVDYEMLGKIADTDPRGALRAYLDPNTHEPITDISEGNLIQKYYPLPRSKIRQLLTGKP